MFETNLHIINKDIMLNSVVSIQKIYTNKIHHVREFILQKNTGFY